MKFKKKYPEGVYTYDQDQVYDPSGCVVCDAWNDDYAKLFAAAPGMLDYLIKKADALEWRISVRKYGYNDSKDSDKKEFDRIIELIKKAGVEVVE